ncbi:MAG: D-alanyl-D-alanine carboxypeptidase/D-alanyl-D-alanine-endopeptidase [Pseudomonadota bacterium]
MYFRRALSKALIGGLGIGVMAGCATAELPPQARRVLAHHGVPAEHVSVYVHEVGIDDPAFVHLADTARNPASTMKLLTTYAALDSLGPGYTWYTQVFAEGEVQNGVLHGDLVLQGGGDPYLVAERLWLLQQRLRLLGVEHIVGDLVFEEGAFAREPGDPGAFDGQPFRTYNVQPAALLMNFQSLVFRFEPDRASGRVNIRSDPPVAGLAIDNRLRLGGGACGGYQRGISFDARDRGDEFRVVFSGTFPAACDRYAMRRALRATDAYNYGIFKGMWEGSGGRLEGAWRAREAAAVQEGREPVLRFPSPSLSEVIRSVNKYSNNVMARHLLLTMASERYEEAATRAMGVRAMHEWLAEKGLAREGLEVENGSGLSRDARMTARHMGELLLQARKSLFVSEYIASLPLSAIDGTLRQRFGRGDLEGRLHMKTGSLDHVSAIAGYAMSGAGREYVVAIMMNHQNAHRGPGEEFQEALIGWLLTNEPSAGAPACEPPMVTAADLPERCCVDVADSGGVVENATHR